MFISNFDQFCFKTGKNYYPQVFLEESKCVVKEKKKIPSDFDREDSDEENSNEKNSDEENSDEENFNEEN